MPPWPPPRSSSLERNQRCLYLFPGYLTFYWHSYHNKTRNYKEREGEIKEEGHRVKERERDRQRERQREKEERQSDKARESLRERQRDRKRERNTHREIERETERNLGSVR